MFVICCEIDRHAIELKASAKVIAPKCGPLHLKIIVCNNQHLPVQELR